MGRALTAAALLADAGLKVAVFEQHVVPGGFAHTWLRRARTRDPVTGAPLLFRFDSGVHDVSGWQPGGTVRSGAIYGTKAARGPIPTRTPLRNLCSPARPRTVRASRRW